MSKKKRSCASLGLFFFTQITVGLFHLQDTTVEKKASYEKAFKIATEVFKIHFCLKNQGFCFVVWLPFFLIFKALIHIFEFWP